jgi:hypothetical protein
MSATGASFDITNSGKSGMIKKPQTFRVCAVCGMRHGVTYGFRNTLKRLGIDGDKAVPACVTKALNKADRLRKVRALPREED